MRIVAQNNTLYEQIDIRKSYFLCLICLYNLDIKGNIIFLVHQWRITPQPPYSILNLYMSKQ